MKKIKVMAGIVVYMPDLVRLKENIEAIQNQVDQVVLFLNGKETEECVRDLLPIHESVVNICAATNIGVASALKAIMEYAIEYNFEWVLNIDQDTVCQPGLIETYTKYIDLPNAGILSCNIIDRNFKQDTGFKDKIAYREVEKCITAGTFMNVGDYRNSDGYDSKMFIDGVDWDICYNFRKYGYKIYKINFDGVLHEVGKGKNITLFGKNMIIYNEKPLRNYYSARNNIYLTKKYPQFRSATKEFLREIRTQILILLYEDDKAKKIYKRWAGIMHGISNKM